ncbi:hypothetical protein HDE_01964 [Halotydeus destructor]|nr:hypothetical protein HDE_01964 [Halotydeus destructor]
MDDDGLNRSADEIITGNRIGNNNNNNSMKKKSVHNVWDHWKVIEKNLAKGSAMDRVQCNYCPLTFLRHAVRCKRHLITCEGPVADDVRRQMQEEIETREPRQTYNSTSSRIQTRKRPMSSNIDLQDEEEDDYHHGANSQLRPSRYNNTYEKKKAVELISDLLHLDNLDIPSSSRRKPLSQYTDADYKREERELDLKIKREVLRGHRLKNELYQRLIFTADKVDPFLDKATHALDLYISDKISPTPPTQQVELVYAHQDTMADGTNSFGNPESQSDMSLK